MKNKGRGKIIVAAIVMVVIIVCVVLGLQIYKPKTYKEVRILTATRGGTYYELGKELADQIFSKTLIDNP